MIWIHNRPIKMGTAGMQEVLMGDPGDSNHRESRGKANQTGDPPRGPVPNQSNILKATGVQIHGKIATGLTVSFGRERTLKEGFQSGS